MLIEGRLKLDRWEKDGQKHSKLKVVGDRLQMLGGKGEGGGGWWRRRTARTRTQQRRRRRIRRLVRRSRTIHANVGGPPPSDDIPF